MDWKYQLKLYYVCEIKCIGKSTWSYWVYIKNVNWTSREKSNAQSWNTFYNLSLSAKLYLQEFAFLQIQPPNSQRSVFLVVASAGVVLQSVEIQGSAIQLRLLSVRSISFILAVVCHISEFSKRHAKYHHTIHREINCSLAFIVGGYFPQPGLVYCKNKREINNDRNKQ